jgi:hypothetical protein
MSHDVKGLYKFGGAAFIASGILFLLRDILDLVAGPPPSGGQEILAWIGSGDFVLAMANEILFVAAVSLVPAVIALYHSLAPIDKVKASVGCGILAMVIPVIAVLDIVHGRLVFPVYGIRVSTPMAAELVVGLFYGGLHATLILLGVATFILSLAMRRGIYGKPIAYLGMITAILDVVASYSYAIGPMLTLVCQVFFAAWFVAVGWRLIRVASRSAVLADGGLTEAG